MALEQGVSSGSAERIQLIGWLSRTLSYAHTRIGVLEQGFPKRCVLYNGEIAGEWAVSSTLTLAHSLEAQTGSFATSGGEPPYTSSCRIRATCLIRRLTRARLLIQVLEQGFPKGSREPTMLSV